MTARRIASALLIALFPVLAGAQEATDDAIIDLTPMFDLMPGEGSEPTPPAGEVTEELPATPDDVVPDEVVPEPETPDVAEPEAETPAVDDAEAETPAEPVIPVVIEAPVRAGTPVAEAPEVAATVHRPLRAPGGTNPLRLYGEFDSTELLVDVGNPTDVVALNLVMQSSVNLLPETSLITVTVNGGLAIASAPFAFDGFAPLEVPTDLLVAGTNRIGVTVEQSHRIFCGPEATFQLWTEIDTMASGLTLTAAQARADINAFAAAAEGMTRITVIASEPPDPALLSEIGRRLASPVTGDAPALTVVGPWDPAPPGPPVPRIAIRTDATERASLRMGADGAPVLIVAPDATPEALDPFLPRPAAPADHPDVIPGTSASLSSLGLADIEIRRRYGRVDVPFALPEDWMLQASQGARIDLLYRYAEGLPTNALMLVKVNGTTVRLLPLFGQPGTVLPLLPVGFSTRLLEAGSNLVSFETIVPGDPPDLPCSPIDGPLVEVFADTQIVVPPSPRMAFPSAATLLRSLDPAGIAPAEGAVPGALADTVAQGLSVAMVPLDGGPETGEARLTVAGLAEIDRLPLTALGLTRRDLEDLLAARLGMPVVAEDAAAPGRMDGMQDWAVARWAGLRMLGWPGDPALAEWLRGRQAVALLLLPDPDERLSGWLVAAPGVDPVWLAEMIGHARLDPDGPKGQAAILSEAGLWTTWRPAATPPALLEPVTFTNVRTVAGNYAAWSPLLYVALLGSLVLVSVIVGLVFIVRTRGRRKR